MNNRNYSDASFVTILIKLFFMDKEDQSSSVGPFQHWTSKSIAMCLLAEMYRIAFSLILASSISSKHKRTDWGSRVGTLHTFVWKIFASFREKDCTFSHLIKCQESLSELDYLTLISLDKIAQAWEDAHCRDVHTRYFTQHSSGMLNSSYSVFLHQSFITHWTLYPQNWYPFDIYLVIIERIQQYLMRVRTHWMDTSIHLSAVTLLWKSGLVHK